MRVSAACLLLGHRRARPRRGRRRAHRVLQPLVLVQQTMQGGGGAPCDGGQLTDTGATLDVCGRWPRRRALSRDTRSTGRAFHLHRTNRAASARAHFLARLDLRFLAFILLPDALLLGLKQVELLEVELLHETHPWTLELGRGAAAGGARARCAARKCKPVRCPPGPHLLGRHANFVRFLLRLLLDEHDHLLDLSMHLRARSPRVAVCSPMVNATDRPASARRSAPRSRSWWRLLSRHRVNG